LDQNNAGNGKLPNKNSVEEFSYPCIIDIKVFLLADENNPTLVRELILQCIERTDLLDIAVKQSSKAKYQSLSCRINAKSRIQIDKVFSILSGHPDILMVL